MAHSHEELLVKLLLQLKHEHVLLWVHIDKKSQTLFEKLKSQQGIHLVHDRVDVKWAHLSQVEAGLHSYREIKKGGDTFGHFLIISGQDFPIRPVHELVSFLSSQPSMSFIGYTPMSKDGWAASMKRFRYYYYIPMEKVWRALMMATGIHRKFPLGLKPYAGPQWINVTEPHMDYILKFCDEHPAMMKFMQTARFPEEMLFQTILLNSIYKDECVNNDLRYVSWQPGKSSPDVLTAEHAQSIFGSKDKFFARKFDAVQSASLFKTLAEKLPERSL